MKILVVDDQSQLLSICERAFREAGYDASTAESGEAALARLGEGWDIVLTDLMMPGAVNGTELLRRVRGAGSADVILMTATPGLSTAIEALQSGAYDYLVKPFAVDQLLLTVKRCIDRRQLSQELAREKALRAQLEDAHAELTRLNRVKETFGQFVTPEVVQAVLAQPESFWQRGDRRPVTVLFADVRGFTPFSSRVSPEEAVETLNSIFRCAVDAVQSEGGIVNKFVGDGMMAVFGAPTRLEDHAACAARAALRALRALLTLRRERQARGKEPLEVCLGINTGEVVAGCLGTEKRTEYSVIGHVVNVASRLEGANKFFGSRIMAGEATYRAAREIVEARELGSVRLVGEKAPLRVFEFLALKGQLADGWKEALPIYARGYSCFNQRRWSEAAELFSEVLRLVPDDGPSKLYLGMAQDYLAIQPPRDWDGTVNLTAK